MRNRGLQDAFEPEIEMFEIVNLLKMSNTATTLSKMRIGSVFLIDPKLEPPKVPKPQDEDYTDAKILFYFPPN